MSTEQAIVSLFKSTSSIRIHVKNAIAAKQHGSSDYEIYATAYCTILVNKIDLCSVETSFNTILDHYSSHTEVLSNKNL